MHGKMAMKNPKPKAESQQKPLSGIKVVDLTRVLAGPWSTQQLADLGADVIKVEKPGAGDDTRHWGPPFLNNEKVNNEKANNGQFDDTEALSAYFICANRGKRSIEIDIQTLDGQLLLQELVGKADVFIENFKSGSLKNYQLDYESLKKLNPKLIYCSITGYGSDGVARQRAGYDALIQAEAGLLSITGQASQKHFSETQTSERGATQQKKHFAKVGVAVADLFTGMYATQGILAALFKRQETNIGQLIEISLYDAQISMLANQASSYMISGKTPEPMGTAHPNIVPYQVFECSDNPVMIAVGTNQQFQNLCITLSLDELIDDKRVKDNKDRVHNRDWLISRLQTAFYGFERDDLLNKFKQLNVPASPVQDFNSLFSSDLLKQRNMVGAVTRDQQSIPIINNPLRFDQQQFTSSKSPPLLGEDTDEILKEWLG